MTRRAAEDPVRALRDPQSGPLEALRRFREAQDRVHAASCRIDPPTCRPGCSACCSQMVFDVAAVEIEDLGQHLRRAGRAAEVLERSLLRRDAYDRVRRDHPRRHGESDDDWIERVALAFWALDLSCVFLDASGHCSVYEHRPQSCRRFFVFGPAEFCAPAAAADPRRLARMSEPGTGEEIDDLLRRLDRRVPFDPEDDRLDHALTRWLQHRSVH